MGDGAKRRRPLVFARGVQIELSLDETAFGGNFAFLLGRVLDSFFARHAGLNTFTETVVRSLQRGELARRSDRRPRRIVGGDDAGPGQIGHHRGEIDGAHRRNRRRRAALKTEGQRLARRFADHTEVDHASLRNQRLMLRVSTSSSSATVMLFEFAW